jgi:hypothetical protein
MWTENEAQIKIKKIASMAVLYKTPLGRNQASKSKFGPNHPLLRYYSSVIFKVCARAQYCAARILKMCREDIEKIQLYKGYF